MAEFRGTWTEEHIVSAVRNNLEAGLKTTANYTFSLEQIRQVVYIERLSIIEQMKRASALFDYEEALQEINCIETDCKDFGLCSKIDTRQPSLHFVLPRYAHLDYLGLATQQQPFKVYTDHSSAYNKYREPRLAERTYVRIRHHKGENHGFIFNSPTPNLKYISARAIFENPREVNKYDCCTYNPRESHFPLPDYMMNQIIDNVTAKWAQYMYRFAYSKADINQTPIDEV